MKKRLICMLLTVLMVVSLFAGAGVSASAETVSYSTMTYRMASGDYVLRICQRLNLNYYVCKPAIMKLNNIQEGQWNKLPVGKLLTLPATDADAVVIATGHGSTATAQTTATTVAAGSTAAATIAATTPSSSATTSAGTSGDIVWWWIVPYQLRSGETIADAMNVLGMSGSQYWGTIQKINQIKDWGSARTDSSILLPTVYPPADGFSRVTIYKHRMLASETPANVVTARGLNYNKIKPMLDILNDVYGGVANVQTGEWLYYPIASNGKVYGKDHADGTYGLFSGLSTENGTVEFYVNGERVYQAKAGATVSYVIKPAKGKAVKDIVLRLSNGEGNMFLNGSSFVMPASDVTLDASFQSGHTITLETNYEGKAAVRVDGVGVDGAAKGAKVMVVSTDPSLAVDELYISYMTLTGAKREQLTNIDQGFVMPDYDVTVEAYLKPVPTYSLFIMDNDDQRVPKLNRPINTSGRFSLEVEGAKVTKAARGAEVKIVPDADTGFTVGQIWVFRHNTNVQIGVFNNTFVMPNVEVDVGVRFVPKGNNIRINPVEGGQFYATIGTPDATNGNPSTIANRDANAVDEAGTNVPVYLNWIPDPNQPGYNMAGQAQIDLYVVTRNSDGLHIPVTWVDGAPSFRMPAGGATVTGGVVSGAQTYTARVYLDGVLIPNGQFKGVSLYTKGDSAAQRSEFRDGSGTTTDGQANVPTVVGEYITLSYDGGESIIPARYEVWDAAQANQLAEESDQADQSGCFKMPNQPVVIRAYFVSGTVKLENADVTVFGSGTVGMLGLNDAGNAWNSVSGVKVGQPFAISLSPSEGFFFNNGAADGSPRLLVKRKDNGGTIAMLDPAVAADSALIQLFDTRPEFVVANPAQALDANNPGVFTGEFVYFFDSMPECGVTVEAVFDEVEYVLQLRAEDETGAALNAGGFWKVRINDVDNVVENHTSTLNAHLDDTITLLFTEAGESKFVFVKSIINNVTSMRTSFTIEGELSRTPGRVIPVTVVLRRISQDGSGNPFELVPFSNARGSTGYMIMNSPSHPATAGTGKQATEAYAGDTVAIFPKPVTPSQYYTDAEHIFVFLPGGSYIAPTPVDADNDGTVDYYTFVMPEKGYDYVDVEFLPVEYTLTVNKDPANAADGLFRVVYDDGTNNDVLINTTFKNAAYGNKIRVQLTEAGRKANLQIDINTSVNFITPAPADWDYWSDGFWFEMPDKNTTLTVYLLDENGNTTKVPVAPADPVNVTLPAVADVDGGGTLKLKYETEDGMTIAGGTAVKSGTKLKVIVDQTLTTQVLDGQIEFYKNTDKLAQADDGAFFTVPDDNANPPVDYTLTAKVKLVLKQYWVKINVENAPTDAALTVSVDGGAAVSVTNGKTLSPKVPHGKTITFTAAATSSRDIGSVDGLTVTSTLPAKTASGTLGPTGKNDGDTVTLTVKFAANEYTLKSASEEGYGLKYYTDPAMTAESEITTGKAAEGTTLYVKAVVEDANYVTKITITDDRATDNVTTLNGNGEAYVVNGNMTKAEVKKDAKVISAKITYANAPAGLKTEVNSGGKVEGSSVTVTGIKAASNVLTILLHEPADFAFGDTAGGDTGKFTATKNEFYKYTVTIDFAKVDNDDVVNVELDIVTPNYTLPPENDSGVPLEWFKSDLTTKVDIDNVPYGTEVYCKATLASTRYVTQIKINDQTFTTPKNNVFFGPYKVTSSVDKTKVVPSGADKTVTITGVTAPDGATLTYSLTPKGGTATPKYLAELTGLKDGDQLEITVSDATISSGNPVTGLSLVSMSPTNYIVKIDTTVLTSGLTNISITLNA